MAVASDDGDDVGRILDDGAEVVLAPANVQELLFAFGDVARHAANDGRRSVNSFDGIAVLPDAEAGGQRLNLHQAGGGAVAEQRQHVVIKGASAIGRQQVTNGELSELGHRHAEGLAGSAVRREDAAFHVVRAEEIGGAREDVWLRRESIESHRQIVQLFCGVLHIVAPSVGLRVPNSARC